MAVAGVLAVALVLHHQLPLLRADHSPARRPDDLAAVSRLAARKLGPGDPVLFLPAQTRNVAITYPGAFRGVRDVALAESAAASGTLYGREIGAGELRRRLARLDRVWVVADQAVLDGRWVPGSPAERLKLAVLAEEFSQGEQAARDGVTVRLYVRRTTRIRLIAPMSSPMPRPGRR